MFGVYHTSIYIMENSTTFKKLTTPVINATDVPLPEWFTAGIKMIRWCSIPLIIIGTITNILNIIVFSRPKLRTLSTAVFLLCLACANLSMIYFQLFRIWFEWVNLVDPESYFSDGYCKIGNYFDVSSRDFSNWLVAAITAERIIVLALPLKTRSICTVKIARWVAFFLFVFVFGTRSHFLILSQAQFANYWVCWQAYPSQQVKTGVLILEYLTGYSAMFLVVAENIILVILLVTQKKTQSSKDNKDKQLRSLTQMLLGDGILFLICEFPQAIIPIYHQLNKRTLKSELFSNISFAMSGVNHASNFFIYMLRGERFRQVLYDLLPCCSGRNREMQGSEVLSVRTVSTIDINQ